MELNAQQKKAVLTTEGRVLVLAGAGSGKTRVLTTRIVHLIRNGVPPKDILGLTFTNKAAAEMRERVGQLAEPPLLSTFHSFCMLVLRKHIDKLGWTRNFTIYDERDVKRLVESLEDPDGLLQALRAHNAVDFDHMLALTVKLFEEHPEVLELYSYRYVMIDEYQDTNEIQFHLTELITRKHGNLCVVGDDDQSIYGWRGAKVANILNFADATTIKLEQNYRSTGTILAAANAVIAHNRDRHDKKLWSSQGEGQPIEIFHTKDEMDEAAHVVYRIDQLRKQGLRWHQIAILYRSNSLSRAFERELMRYNWQLGDEWNKGIPYEVYGGQAFYDRGEVKDILAYLRVMVNPRDEAAILRTINLPRRGVGEKTLDRLTQQARSGTPLYEILKQNDHAGIKRWVKIIEEGKERFDLEWLVERINYKQAIEEDVKSEKMRAFKWENVQELILSAKEETSLHDFVSSISLDYGKKKRNPNAVNLMTIHSAKGLEFDACFLVGMEDHIIPNPKGEFEEERRLMYVACTRAKKQLTISMARERSFLGRRVATKPSRFLLDIPKDLRSR